MAINAFIKIDGIEGSSLQSKHKGEIDLELEGGDTRTVQAGDFVVQRGTNHRWINRSGDWMQMVAILVSARPVLIGGEELPEIHI